MVRCLVQGKRFLDLQVTFWRLGGGLQSGMDWMCMISLMRKFPV